MVEQHDERQDRADAEQHRRAARQGRGPIRRDREQRRSRESRQEPEEPNAPVTVTDQRHPDEPDDDRDRPDHGQREGHPGQDRVRSRLEGAEAGEGHEQDPQPGEQQDRGDGVIDIHEAIGQETGDRQECAAEDRGDAADAERHGDTPFLQDAGPTSAPPELGVEGAYEDVRHVERAERAFLEDRLELVAVAGPPPGRITTDQERPHDGVWPS